MTGKKSKLTWTHHFLFGEFLCEGKKEQMLYLVKMQKLWDERSDKSAKTE